MKTTRQIRKAAITLAVAYRAHGKAMKEHDWNGVWCFGRMFLEARTILGIPHDEIGSNIADTVAHADSMLRKREAA